MRRASFTISPAIDNDGIAAAQSASAAGYLTLNGALVSGGKWSVSGYGQKVAVTSVGVDTGITFTVYGKDVDGKATTEVLTGTSASAVTTSAYYKEVSSVLASGATNNTVKVGLVALSASPTYVVNYKMENFKASLAEIVSGTINGTCQHTFDDIFASTWTEAGATWFPHDAASLSAFTANQDANYAFPPTACRTIVNTASSGSAITFVVIVPA